MKKAQIHCHTNRKQKLFYLPLFYDAVQSTEDLINECVENHIKILAITDHDTFDGYFEAKKIIEEKSLDILLIKAVEISSRNNYYEHVLAYGIRDKIPKSLGARETIEIIHQQGGVAVAAHPFMPTSLENKITKENFDAIEGYNSLSTKRRDLKAREVAKQKSIPITSGADAHQKEEVSRNLIIFRDSVETEKDFLEALRKGDFSIEKTSYTPKTRMVFRHIWRNIKIQIGF